MANINGPTPHVVVTLSMSVEQWQVLKAAAERENRNLSNYIKTICLRHAQASVLVEFADDPIAQGKM